MKLISQKKAASLLLQALGHIDPNAKPELGEASSESWSVHPDPSSLPLSSSTDEQQFKVSGTSMFANDTRQMVPYGGKIYWIWHSSMKASDVLSVDPERTISVELHTENLVLSKLIFSTQGEPVFIARKTFPVSSQKYHIIFCNTDFSVRWSYDIGEELVYKVLFSSVWNSVICVTQGNANGKLFKTIYRFDGAGALVWKKQLPLCTSGGALSISFSGEDMEVLFGDQRIILSSSGELRRENTYPILLRDLILTEGTTYASAYNITEKKNIEGGAEIQTADCLAIYRINGDMPPLQVICESDMSDFWIVQGHILLTTLGKTGIWNLICYSLEGVRMWSIELVKNLSCAPISLGNGRFLLCTDGTYSKALDAMDIMEIVVSMDGTICGTKRSHWDVHSIQDAYIHEDTIWCLRSGTTRKKDPESHCTLCEWVIEASLIPQ